MANSVTLGLRDRVPPKVEKIEGDPDRVIIHGRICDLRPQTGLKWVIRDGQKVLQQAWIASSECAGWTVTHVDWRDVPIEIHD